MNCSVSCNDIVITLSTKIISRFCMFSKMTFRQTLLILIPLTCLYHCDTRAEFLVTHFPGTATRDSYDIKLLQLALEKTQTKYGSFRLAAANDVPVNRRLALLQQNAFANLVVFRGYDDELQDSGQFIFINFPMDLGALGWRICFTNPTIKEKIKSVKTLGDLRQYSIVQNRGWADSAILKDNGFRVIELENRPTLFQMVASGRADLFCRGFNELQSEYLEFKNIGNLTYDESFLIIYKMPVFFYLNSSNKLAKNRIEEGLKAAYEDGSMMQLWLEKFKDSSAFANLKKRKIFQLNNFRLKKLSNEYEKYLIDPLTLE